MTMRRFVFSRVFPEALAKLQFLSGIPFVAEPADAAECGGLDEDEGAGHEFSNAADQVPKRGDPARDPLIVVHADRHAAAEHAS